MHSVLQTCQVFSRRAFNHAADASPVKAGQLHSNFNLATIWMHRIDEMVPLHRSYDTRHPEHKRLLTLRPFVAHRPTQEEFYHESYHLTSIYYQTKTGSYS